MPGAYTIKNAVNKLIEQEGYNPKTSSNEQKIAEYTSYYKGKIDKFHTYTEKVNGKYQKLTRKSSQTAKMVSEDWASIIWSELLEMIHSDEKINDEVHNILNKNNFQVMFGHGIEYAFGQSEHLLYEFLDNNEVFINFINVHYYMVLDHWNGIPTVVYAWEQDTLTWTDEEGNQLSQKVLKTSLFKWLDGVGTTKTRFYRLTEKDRISDLSPLDAGSMIEGFKAEWSAKLDRPHFQVIKPNIANNHDFQEMRGMAIHANAADDIKTIDVISTAFEWEYISGENKVIITKEALDKDLDFETGAYSTAFDTTKRVYVVAEGLEESPVNVVKWELRADDFDKGMNSFYSKVAQRCGLEADFYLFKEGTVYINKDAVLSSRGRLFRNKAKHEQIIKFVLESVWNTIINLKGLKPDKDKKLTLKFDDSLFTDKDAEEAKSIQKVKDGFKLMWRHLFEWDPTVRGDEVAAKALATELAAAQMNQDIDLLGIDGNQ